MYKIKTTIEKGEEEVADHMHWVKSFCRHKLRDNIVKKGLPI